MKKFVFTGLGACAILAMSVSASAQQAAPSGLSLRGGMFFPSDSNARDTGKMWFGLGLDYKLKNVNVPMGASSFAPTYSVSLDWISKGSYTNLPILFNLTTNQDKFYFSAGVGVAFQKVPIYAAGGGGGTGGGGGSTNPISLAPAILGSESRTRFAFQLSAGMNIPAGMNTYFVEARYFGGSAELAGFGLFGGIRF